MDKFVERQEVLKLLNAPTPEERLANLAILIGGEKEKPEVSLSLPTITYIPFTHFPRTPRRRRYTVPGTRVFRQPESWITTASPEP